MCEKLYSQSYGKNEELWNAPKYSWNTIGNTTKPKKIVTTLDK